MRHRNVALSLLLSLLLAGLAWATEYRLTSTGLTPSAEGKVIADTDRNGNTKIDIEVKRLAKPQSLTEPKQAYLVWVQPRGKSPELLGALRVNDNLEGSLKASVPYNAFDIFVTAEDNLKPETPGSTVVLKGSVENK